MIIVALALTIAAVIVALARGASMPTAASAIGMGALMVVPVAVRDVTPLMTMTLGGAFLLVVMAMVALERRQGVTAPEGEPRLHWQRCVGALAVVDLGFMSIAALVMPVHTGVQLAAQSLAAAAVSASGGGEPHGMASGELMLAAVLGTWLACAAVLIIPMLRAERMVGVSHAACSGLMIAAMAAMAMPGA